MDSLGPFEAVPAKIQELGAVRLGDMHSGFDHALEVGLQIEASG